MLDKWAACSDSHLSTTEQPPSENGGWPFVIRDNLRAARNAISGLSYSRAWIFRAILNSLRVRGGTMLGSSPSKLPWIVQPAFPPETRNAYRYFQMQAFVFMIHFWHACFLIVAVT